MNLADVMDEIAAQLDTITGLRTYPYPPDSLAVPAAVVTYPSEYLFDETYGRGMDRLKVPVIVLVGKVSDRKSRDQLAAYCSGSGASSIKAVVEAGTYTAFDEARVERIEFDVIKIAAVEYVAGTFTLDIAGTGA
jgi:hypothetical protein